MHSNIGKTLRLSLLLASGTLSMAAYAQAPSYSTQSASQEAGETRTADIIVTAQRRSELLQKVPMTVNVATGEQLQKLAIFDFKDVQQLAAGLELTNNDGRTNVATIRGITFQPDSGAQPSVDLYFNEVPVDPQTFFTGLYDVGQIEVLRGPQGIFRGRTSPAGAITITTRRPDLDKPDGYMEVTGTTRDAINAQGGASIPLIPGKLAIRAAGLVDFNRATHIRDVTLGENSRQITMSGRLSIAFQPTERFKGNLTYQYLWQDSTPFIAAFGPGNAPYAGAAGIPGLDVNLGGFIDPSVRSGPPLTIQDRESVSSRAPRFTNKTHIVALDTELELADHTAWSFNAGYQYSRIPGDIPLDYTNAIPGSPSRQVIDYPQETITLESRVTSTGPGFFNWMVGGYYQRFHANVVVDQDATLFYGIPGVSPVPPSFFSIPINAHVEPKNTYHTYAAFGSARLNFSDHLRLEAGLRYTHYMFNSQSYLSVCLATGCPLQNFPTKTDDNAHLRYNALTGGANLSYDLSPDATAYVAYGHSYRPGVAANGVTVTVSQDLLVSHPEKSDSVEVGLKASLFDRRVSLNIDAFYQKFNGYIDYFPGLAVRTTNAATGTQTISAIPTGTNGDAISKGIEMELNGRITNDWDMGLNASYVNAHYDNAVMPCNVTGANGQFVIPAGQEAAMCTRNDRIAQVPRFNATLNGEYRFHAGNLTPFVRGLVRYRPGFNSILNNFRYQTFTNVNLYIGVRGRDDRWELTAFVKNLLDQARATSFVSSAQGQRGTTSIVDFVSPGPSFLSGYRTAVISPPREFGLTARFNW